MVVSFGCGGVRSLLVPCGASELLPRRLLPTGTRERGRERVNPREIMARDNINQGCLYTLILRKKNLG